MGRKNQPKGIIFIPLFFAIPIIIVGLYFGAGTGFWENMTSGIRKFLAPPSPSNLPQQLGQWQQEPTPIRTPTPTIKLEGKVQTKPFVFKKETSDPKTNVPSFVINAPSGWLNRTSSNELASFGAPEEDKEQVDEKQMYSVQAVVTIRATNSYKNLEDFTSQVKASGSRLKEYQLVNFNGRTLETKYKSSKDGRIKHELDYLLHKDGVSFLISGIALDSAWDKHAGEIRNSLNSFKFN